ncbi:MAG: class I SAM-dependent methyltransferase [Prosthecobacter sp.]
MTRLATLLQTQLSTLPLGRMPFAQVMEMALYHPEHGYYGPGPRRIGRQGDFFTSVSVGPLFGRLLARQAVAEWQAQEKPDGFTIIEQGAHDGQLAEDILNALNEKPMRYVIVEPNPRHQEAQRHRLGSRVEWVESLSALQTGPKHAFFLCNELPDAFPVHLVRWNGESWQELFVETADAETFLLVPGELTSPALAAEVARLPTDLDPGHTLEINLTMLDWARELARAAFQGVIFIADYGLDEDEFFVDSRASGTIRRYHQHQMDGRVLEDLGECDLTTHINFTRLIEETALHGLTQREYDLQGRVLGRLAMPWLQSLEGSPPDAATLRQFQSLTHPAMMGRSFRCLILEKPARA